METNLPKSKKKPRRVVRTILLFLLCGTLIILPVAKDTLGFGWSDAARIGAAVATGGVSELIIRAVKTIKALIDNVTQLITNVYTGILDTIMRAKTDFEGEIDTITGTFNDSKRALLQTSHDASSFVARYEGREVDSSSLSMYAPGTQLSGQQGGEHQIKKPSAGSSGSETPESKPDRPKMVQKERAGNIDLSAQTGQQVAKAQLPHSTQGEQKCPEYEQAGGFDGSGRIALSPAVPVVRDSVLVTLKRAEDKIKTLKSTTYISLGYSISSKISKAREEWFNVKDVYKADAEVLLLDPLKGARDTVVYYLDHPEEFLAGGPYARVNKVIEDINNRLDSTLRDLYEKTTRDPMKTLGETERDIRSAQANAALAREIYQKMTALEQCPTQRKLAALDSLSNSLSNTRLARVEGLQVSGVTAQYTPNTAASKHHVQRALNNYKKIKKFRAEYRSHKKSMGGVDQYTRMQAEREFDRLFKNKTTAEVERAKSQIMVSVRQRFGKFPTIVSRTQKYIDREAKLRMGGSTPSKKTALAVTQAPRIPFKKSMSSSTMGRKPSEKSGTRISSSPPPAKSAIKHSALMVKSSNKSMGIKRLPKAPVPSKTAQRGKNAMGKKTSLPITGAKTEPIKSVMKKPGQRAVLPRNIKLSKRNAAIDTVSRPDKPAAMKKPVKRVPKTVQMARKEVHPQPKAGIPPVHPAPRPAKVTPPKGPPAKMGTVTSKRTTGKTGKAGIIFVSRAPSMNKTRQLQVGGQQVTILVTGKNLNKIRSAQVIDKNNRAVLSSVVRVMGLHSDKPTELKVTLRAFAMPKGGGTYKLVLKGGGKSVETPVRLKIIAAQKKRIMPRSLLPVRKKR